MGAVAANQNKNNILKSEGELYNTSDQEKQIRTRSGRSVVKPRRYRLQKCINLITNAYNAFRGPGRQKEGPQWRRAEEAELQRFRKMEGLELAKISKNLPVIPTRWEYIHKTDNLKGAVYKARCVVQAFRQTVGIQYNHYKILSPVVDLTGVRVSTAIATKKNTTIHHLDIQLAHLNAPLPENEEIYANQDERKRRILLVAQEAGIWNETIRT